MSFTFLSATLRHSNKRGEGYGDRLKTTHKNRIIILPLLAALLAAAGVSLAVFTYQANKKGVISTESIDIYFASNYLKLCENYTGELSNIVPTNYDEQTLIFKRDEQTGRIFFDFTVQNYVVAGENNPNTIEYQLIFVLVDPNEGDNLDDYYITDDNSNWIRFTSDNLSMISGTYTLNGVYDSENVFRVNMPASALDHARLLVMARPTDDSLRYTNNKMLARLFSPCTSANVKAFEVTGEFLDRAIAGKMPFDFDGFNYLITVNTGRGAIALQWDPREVTIDPFFEERVEAASMGTSNGMETLTFEMDAGSELVQFYRVDPPSSATDWQQSWGNMEAANVIRVTGTPTDIAQ